MARNSDPRSPGSRRRTVLLATTGISLALAGFANRIARDRSVGDFDSAAAELSSLLTATVAGVAIFGLCVIWVLVTVLSSHLTRRLVRAATGGAFVFSIADIEVSAPASHPLARIGRPHLIARTVSVTADGIVFRAGLTGRVVLADFARDEIELIGVAPAVDVRDGPASSSTDEPMIVGFTDGTSVQCKVVDDRRARFRTLQGSVLHGFAEKLRGVLHVGESSIGD